MILSTLLDRIPRPLLFLVSLPSRLRQAIASPTAPIYAAIAAERLSWYLLLGCLVSWLGDINGPAAYGNLVAAAYILPLAGGFIGGRWSLRGAAIAGALLLTAGYAIVAASATQPIFLLGSPSPATLRLAGFATLAIGCGLFKPCLSTLVGTVVAPARRAATYGRFYSAINLGSLPSTLLGAYLHNKWGWATAFAFCAAAAGTSALILIVASKRLRSYQPSVEEAVAAALRSPAATLTADNTFRPLPLAVLLAGGAAFFACYYQMGTTLMLYAKPLLGDPETLQTFNSLFVLCLALTPIATWQSRLRWRCALSLGATAAAFAALAVMPRALSTAATWFFLITLAEVLISPLGMDIACKYVPRRWAAVATAAWFLSIAAGGKIAGVVAGLGVNEAVTLSLFVAAAGALWFAVLGGTLDATAQPRPAEIAHPDTAQRLRVTRYTTLAHNEVLLPGTELQAVVALRLGERAAAWLCRRGGVDYVVPSSSVEVVA